MTEPSSSPTSPDVSPAVALRQLSTGFWIAKAVAVAAELGLADHLMHGPKTVEELAQAVGAHPGALYRLLRGIAGVGVFAEDAQGRFTLTPLAALLLTDNPQSWRAAAMLNGAPWIWQPWGDLLYSVKTGKPAFDRIFGMEFDAYLAQHQDAAEIFQAFMQVATAEEALAVAPIYDFSGMTSVVDVGGGRGALLGAILQANTHLRGVLFETPHVIASARPALEAQGVADRCQFVAGDFFETLPAGGDAYILKWILVSWDDERAVAILQNCHRAMRANAKLLVVERIIPPGNEPFFGKLADLNLLVMYKGRHRTEVEYRTLLARAGFELSRIIPTHSPTEFSVIEGVPR
ncbi:MAG TPA: methyltransferase [Candidatus Tectomicrobia bacterium]